MEMGMLVSVTFIAKGSEEADDSQHTHSILLLTSVKWQEHQPRYRQRWNSNNRTQKVLAGTLEAKLVCHPIRWTSDVKNSNTD